MLTVDSLSIELCCVSEAGIQDSTSMLTKCSKYFVGVFSGQPSRQNSSIFGQHGGGIAFDEKDESHSTRWNPICTRLIVLRLQELVGVRKNSCVKRRLLVTLIYTLTDCSTGIHIRSPRQSLRNCSPSWNFDFSLVN